MIDQEKIKQAVRLLLEGIGEDPSQRGAGRDAGADRPDV